MSDSTALYALDAKDLVEAHGNCLRKVHESYKETVKEAIEAVHNVRAARRGKFNSKPFVRILKQLMARRRFLYKVGAAIRQGYMVVPNFEVDLIAVRTNRKNPTRRRSDFVWGDHTQQGQPLAIREGEYKSATPEVFRSEVEGDRHSVPTGWKDVSFPLGLGLAKPEIISKTDLAMKLGIFDEIGVARDSPSRSRVDPFILGIVRNPKRGRPDASFFIAWALDPRRW